MWTPKDCKLWGVLVEGLQSHERGKTIVLYLVTVAALRAA